MSKSVIERLRHELEIFLEGLKVRNKLVNLEYNYNFVAMQLKEHQMQPPRKKSMSLLKPSVLNEVNMIEQKVDNNNVDVRKSKSYRNKLGGRLNEDNKFDQKNGVYDMRGDEFDDDSEFIEATENFSLRDAPLPRTKMQERRASVVNTLNKVKKSICPSVEVTAKMLPSPKSSSSKSSTPSPARMELSPTPSPPLALPLPQPGDSVTQETFLRLLGLITPHQRTILEKKRNERKKRSTTSTNKNEFVYESFESIPKKRKNNFPYLQQNVGPPQTRSQKMRRQQLAAKHTVTNAAPTVSPSPSPPPSWPTTLRIPTGLTIQAVRSPPVSKLCTVCGQNESQSALINCGRCRNYFHSSCGSSPSSRSPSSRSRSPINGPSDRKYRRTITICPECGEEVKENKTWTVIPRNFSHQNGLDERYKDKLHEKRLLVEKNRHLRSEKRKLEERFETLKENVEASNIEKKQLISNQNNTKKHLKVLLEFVSKFKDTTVSFHTLPGVEPFLGRKEITDTDELSNGS